MSKSASTAESAVGGDEAGALFAGLEDLRGLVLAVSGGPDSTALLLIAARWARRRKRAPKLLAVTVDHGLRAQSAAEARAVARLARRLGVPHQTLRWRGTKPASGIQEAARRARYALLAQATLRAGYGHIATAHTLDDQAETVLFRLARGSGLTGLGGMARMAPLPIAGKPPIVLLRPLLGVPKARLMATLQAAGVGFSDDPSNRDPRFTRPRLRTLLPSLAREGLDAHGLARLAVRLRRAEVTVEFAVAAAHAALSPRPWQSGDPIVLPAAPFRGLPAEVALRLLGKAIAHAGDEGPVELAKLESLHEALLAAQSGLRRTLAGALVALSAESLTIMRAPPRRGRRVLAMRKNRNRRFKK